MKKTLWCILAVLIITLCFSGCQQNSGTAQAEQTRIEIQQTTSAAAQTAEPSETASFPTATKILEESIEAEPEEEAVPYIPDPEIVFTMDCYEDSSYINQPMFISGPEGSDASVYVMLADESKMWEYYAYMFDETFSTSEYVIIEHNGIADEIPCRWAERFGDPFTVYSGDFDGDGETEIAAARYSVGGTLCCISEFSVFKMVDGHYQCFTIDNMDIIGRYVSYEIDNENHTIEFTVSGTDSSFVMNTPEYFEGEVKGVSYGNAVWYFVNGNDITMTVYLFLPVSDRTFPFTDLKLTMKVNFSDGEFACSEPVFEISEY